MEFELALKVVALVVSAMGAWKVLSESTRARRTSVRDDYRFAKEFLTDLRAKESMHPYLRDRATKRSFQVHHSRREKLSTY
jgi:hypothetical protein